MNSVTPRVAALAIGLVFVAVGLLGFVPNPLVSPGGLFAVNGAHNIVHIVSGLVLLGGVGTALGPTLALRIVGVVYGIVALLGFVMSGDMLLGLIHVNQADRWLHVALAAVILAAGFGLPSAAAPDRVRAVR
ncbi:MAG: DUF4383 domain-containing protein [Alphaproteobacteria bacterium]|nr:DUF4383 domain-containing protein [Alphaproteobacteria bacterium]